MCGLVHMCVTSLISHSSLKHSTVSGQSPVFLPIHSLLDSMMTQNDPGPQAGAGTDGTGREVLGTGVRDHTFWILCLSAPQTPRGAKLCETCYSVKGQYFGKDTYAALPDRD